MSWNLRSSTAIDKCGPEIGQTSLSSQGHDGNVPHHHPLWYDKIWYEIWFSHKAVHICFEHIYVNHVDEFDTITTASTWLTWLYWSGNISNNFCLYNRSRKLYTDAYSTKMYYTFKLYQKFKQNWLNSHRKALFCCVSVVNGNCQQLIVQPTPSHVLSFYPYIIGFFLIRLVSNNYLIDGCVSNFVYVYALMHDKTAICHWLLFVTRCDSICFLSK